MKTFNAQMHGFVYLTTNNVTSKKYIGMCSSKQRFNTYLGSGKILKQAVAKYGKENFCREILEECFDEDSLRNSERKWIEHYDAINSTEFYNMCEGGRGGNTGTGRSTSEQTKQHWLKKSAEEKSRIGKKSVDTRKAQGVTYSGKYNPTAIKVKVLDESGEKVYECLKDYADEKGIPYSSLKGLYTKFKNPLFKNDDKRSKYMFIKGISEC